MDTFGFLKGKSGYRSKSGAYRSAKSRFLWYSVALGWKIEGVVVDAIEQMLCETRLWGNDLRYPYQRKKDILKFFHHTFRDMGCPKGRPDKSRGRLQMLKRLYKGDPFKPLDAAEEWKVSWSGARRIVCEAVANGYCESIRRGVYRFTDLKIEDHENPSHPRPAVAAKEIPVSKKHPKDRVLWNDGVLRRESILSNRANDKLIDKLIDACIWPEEGPAHLFEPLKLAFRAGQRRRRARERKKWRPWTELKKTLPEKVVLIMEQNIRTSHCLEGLALTPAQTVKMARQVLAREFKD